MNTDNMSIGGFTIDYGPFAYLNIMYKKLGFEFDKEGDLKLIQWMLGTLGSSEVDYTNFFRILCHYNGDKEELLALANLTTPLNEWLEAYDDRLKEEKLSIGERKKNMCSVNPKYVLRNHIIQEAIEE